MDEFDNIYNNALTLVSPLTGNLAVGGFDLTGIGELAFNNAGAATAAGRLRRNATNLTFHDGTAARILYMAAGATVVVTDGGTGLGTLTQNGVLYGNGTSAVGVTAAPGAKKVLVGNSGAPVWQGPLDTGYGGTGQDFSATAQGNIFYTSAAGVVSALGPGTAGKFFQTAGTGANPVWASAVSATQDVTDIETTTSTSYTNLATSGPAVTLTPGWTSNQVILVKSALQNSASDRSWISVAIAGASAVDGDGVSGSGTTATLSAAVHILASTVANGATHTMKYKVNSGTGTFGVRRISAYVLSG